ncbi:exodeoxyribonuclease VII large subunit [Myroides sp. LoEW2-1]|uniref:exodeoxyribonuclease VII large subunit n=1 Tax=Myroides sp. LoEW2-1 TaxID=2683192 RepID=UPI00132BBBCD|nr:exodeoxyribonuclease VII large subunit [Myroides sp. LoEW2-1]MVX36405.1 exodeoxyribonuclease VII large subunit [Myroides sp. LoEW2-1]
MKEEIKWFTLSTILGRVKQIFDESISGHTFWMKVEISQFKRDRRGHVYLELVENSDGVVLAKARGTIWNHAANVIYSKLDKEANNILKEGAEILCLCEVVYNVVFGFSVNVLDVDLSFSLGEVERRKQEAIKKLEVNGLLDLNKKLSFPLVIQKIALVGSLNTAGHIDFINQLEQNEYGFAFDIDYFDCRVQGDNAHVEIINKLNQIPENTYDVVVLLRGGGAALDLDEFNNYALAEVLARLHTAVFTGIGHEVDTTVADFVANKRFKTPSAVAAFIVERAVQFHTQVKSLYDSITSIAKQQVEIQGHVLEKLSSHLKIETSRVLLYEKNKLKSDVNLLVVESNGRIQKEHSVINLASQTIHYAPSSICLTERNKLREKGSLVAYLFGENLRSNKQNIAQLREVLELRVSSTLKKEKLRVEHLEQIPNLYDLDSLMKMGLAIVWYQNKTINEFTSLREGDVIQVDVFNKRFEIVIKDIKEKEKWKHLPMKAQ